MKKTSSISVICSIIGLFAAGMGLVVGVQSINAPGWGGLGVIFIVPSIIELIIILIDFLISIDNIKKGLVYSWISTLIKLGIIVLMIPSIQYNYNYEKEFHVSNLSFDIMVVVFLLIIAVPSICNIIKLSQRKKQEIKE